MEIITGVERRRRWRLDEKLRSVAEVDDGGWLAEVTRRHEVSRGLLWSWCRQVRQGSLARSRRRIARPAGRLHCLGRRSTGDAP